MPDAQTYTELAARRYVQYLCLWSCPDPPQALHLRSDEEYRRALLNLLKVNETRRDLVSKWECAAARAQLEALADGH